jgi:hypothetical protein
MRATSLSSSLNVGRDCRDAFSIANHLIGALCNSMRQEHPR